MLDLFKGLFKGIQAVMILDISEIAGPVTWKQSRTIASLAL